MPEMVVVPQSEGGRRIALWMLFVSALLLTAYLPCTAASKVHVVTLGKWTTVQGQGTGEGKPVSLKVRALIVDGRVKEYTLGATHEITDRLFVAQRALRINDSLPDETAPHWQWQQAGWLMVDRLTGRISALSLPEFDSLYSAASWYRDYAAYCGVAEDGKKTYAVVAQIGRRKPVLKKLISPAGAPDSGLACPSPAWQRNPVRVSFDPPAGTKQMYAIRGRVIDVMNDEDEDDEAAATKP